ncbi:MAG: DUF1697 domain-containing protein [Pyrinomonadaceae bacterium]|nr:DUF1697 domain-containing protein [Pyrinomonadaceae bacterium]
MRYVALLRGINVGGHNKIKMDELRPMFESLGFENVKSYIASGNVAFDSRKTKDETIVNKLAKAIKEKFSLEIDVMIRTIEEVREAIKKNPFEKDHTDDTKLFLVFLKEPLPEEKAEMLLSHNNENERFFVNGRDIYALSKKGFMQSILAKKYIDNKLKTPATGRNWRTVNKIAEL